MKKSKLPLLGKFKFNSQSRYHSPLVQVRSRHLTGRNKKLWTMDYGLWTKTGFTLIELLIALLLIAIISTAFLGLFKRGGLVWQKGERRVQSYQNARIILGQLTRELSAVYVGPENNFDGKSDEIEFYANIWSGDSVGAAEGLVKLGYKKDAGGENILDRLYKVDLSGAAPPYIEFAFYFQSIAFKYFDASGTGFDSWDYSVKGDLLPSKVKITVTTVDTKTYTTAVSIPQH